MKKKTRRKKNREFTFRDPKIHPRPEEAANIAVEYAPEELQAIKEVVRAGGYWSIDELLRTADADFVRKHMR